MSYIEKVLLLSILMVILVSCKDDKLTMQRQPYLGNELRINGYYYCQEYNQNINSMGTIVKYLYRNGIILCAYYFTTTDLNEVEAKMLTEYDLLQHDKSRWGVFIINGNNIECEGWTTSVGGGLPIFRWHGIILNDSTYCEEYSGAIYHFRRFSPKPDSTNKFIK